MGCLDAFPRGQKTFEKICIYRVQCLKKKKKCLCGVILQMCTAIYIFSFIQFPSFPILAASKSHRIKKNNIIKHYL